jgi:hypothetical protein
MIIFPLQSAGRQTDIHNTASNKASKEEGRKSKNQPSTVGFLTQEKRSRGRDLFAISLGGVKRPPSTRPDRVFFSEEEEERHTRQTILKLQLHTHLRRVKETL